MIDIRRLARALMALMGVYLLCLVALSFVSMFQFLIMGPEQNHTNAIIQVLIVFFELSLLFYFFILRPDIILNLMLRGQNGGQENGGGDILLSAFRLAMVLIGIYLLYSSVSAIGNYIMIEWGYNAYAYAQTPRWWRLVPYILTFVISVYCIAGAPGLVEWHVRRIKASSKF